MKYISLMTLNSPRITALILAPLLLCLFGLANPLRAELMTIDRRGGLDGAYFHPDKTPDLIEVYLIIKSGGFDEGDAPDGLAHYLEHLVWLSAVNPDGQKSTARDEGAWVNGELTLYSMKGPPDQLDAYLAAMAKVFEPPSLDEQFMLEERDIVRTEYDYRVAKTRTYPIVRSLVTRLFGDAPRARSVIGTPDSIAAMTPKAALDLHARTHVPANAVLFVIGNADLATVEQLVDKHLGDFPAGSPPPELTPPPYQERRDIIETHVENAAIQQLIFFKRVKLDTLIASDRLAPKLDLLHAIFASTLEGSLAKPLRYDDFITRRFELGLAAIEPGEVLMTFSAAPDDGVTLAKLLEAFETALKDIAEQGVPDETFDRVMKKRLSSLTAVKGKRRPAIRLVISQTAHDAALIDAETEIERYGQTTLDEVNGLIQALAGPGHVAAALISPDSSN